ncbi:N-acetylneuraminate (7)9-O-acetyltransferase isoform X2 [Haemaphysalis longicornis]
MVEEARHINASSEFIHHINAKNCKIVACFVVAGFVAYHGVVHLTYGIDTCKWLLSDGRFQGYHVWQPYGCMLHTYTNAESRMCLRYIAYWGGQNHIVFMGDSRIRQLYWALVHQVQQPGGAAAEGQQAHRDLRFEEKDLRLTVEFLWRPLVEDGSMRVAAARWLGAGGPRLLVVGGGTWAMRRSNGSRAALAEYGAGVSRLAPLLERLAANGSTVLWALQGPVQPQRLRPGRQALTNELVDAYNRAAARALRHSPGVQLWRSARLVAQGAPEADSPDGLHAGPFVLGYAVQILTNAYCNDHMNYNDGTCCSSPEPVTWLQAATFAAFGVAWALCAVRWLRRRWLAGGGGGSAAGPAGPSALALVSRLGLVMGYFFVCDRTTFFLKENKSYTHLSFFLPVGYLFALGLFFTEEAGGAGVLRREQTDEWKGWMQLVLLAYHVTGASQVLPVYVHVRALVSAYLFLAGYGHFCYFWREADWGLLRLARVLFRTNLLVVLLCLCMNRPYQFYYFVPLVSFWFLVLAATLASPPRVAQASAEANPLHHLYLVAKLVALFALLTVLYLSEFYTTFAFVCRSKPDCNEVHAYIFFVPILSYIILRNMSGLLRARYSTFFAWFGKISLELFIAQYHIWLAADTHGVLVLVPGYPVLNVMVTSLVMVCVAHEVHALTARLTPLAVPADWKYLVRNLALFGLLLVPIGVHDGMF